MPGRTKSAPSGPLPGTTSCPWLIRARAGQRINFTLYNLDRQLSALSVSPDINIGWCYTQDGPGAQHLSYMQDSNTTNPKPNPNP